MNWRTDTYWFDVAIAAVLLMPGNALFGAFRRRVDRRAARALQ